MNTGPIGAKAVICENAFASLFKGNFIKTSTVIARREALAAVGAFDADLRTEEDYDYWLRLSAQTPIVFVDAALIDHRRRPGQLTDRTQLLNISQNVLVVLNRAQSEAEKVIGHKAVRARMADTYEQLAAAYIHSQDHRSARLALLSYIIDGAWNIHMLWLLLWTFIPAVWATGIWRAYAQFMRSRYAAELGRHR